MINTSETELLERELKEKISQLDADKLRRVLAFVEEMEEKEPTKFYTLDELSAMPPEERSKAVVAAFAAAANEDFEIFEANSEDDFGKQPHS